MTISSSPRLTTPVTDRDHIKGSPEALVNLVEYGDYECPDCGRAYSIVEEICRKAGDQLLFAFRNFPSTQSHEHAEMAAEAAEAAAAQQRFWEMHRVLFTHQSELATSNLLQYASRLGMDTEQFRHALSTHAFRDRVHEEFMSGVRSGVNGTPTFFINGARYDGPVDVFALNRGRASAASRVISSCNQVPASRSYHALLRTNPEAMLLTGRNVALPDKFLSAAAAFSPHYALFRRARKLNRERVSEGNGAGFSGCPFSDWKTAIHGL